MSTDSSKTDKAAAAAPTAASQKPAALVAGQTTQTAQAASQPGAITWGPLASILVVVVSYLAAQLVGGLAIALWPHLQGWSTARADAWVNNSVGAQFFYVLIAEGLTVGVLYWFVHRKHASFRSVGLTRPRIEDLAYTSMGIAAYLVLYVVAVSAVSAVFNLNTTQQQDVGFQTASGAFALTLTFLSLVILPPLVEEIMFRGVLFSGLKRSRLGVVGAALLTSLLFAAPHLLESSGSGLLWIAGIDTFVLSLVLCYLRQKTGRLWAGIGVHALKNCIAFVSVFVMHLH